MTAVGAAELADALGTAVLLGVVAIALAATVAREHERRPRLVRAAARLLLAPVLVPVLLARSSRRRFADGASDWSLLTGTPLDIDVPASLAARRLR